MRNAELGEAQAGIKIAGRNINSLRYADDTALRWKECPRLSTRALLCGRAGRRLGVRIEHEEDQLVTAGIRGGRCGSRMGGHGEIYHVHGLEESI